jgi:hypothetical protein
VSITTIYRAIHAGNEADRLRAANVGAGRKSSWRITPDDLDAWVKRKEGGSPLPPPQTYQAVTEKSRHFRF